VSYITSLHPIGSRYRGTSVLAISSAKIALPVNNGDDSVANFCWSFGAKDFDALDNGSARIIYAIEEGLTKYVYVSNGLKADDSCLCAVIAMQCQTDGWSGQMTNLELNHYRANVQTDVNKTIKEVQTEPRPSAACWFDE
jgi:hypothetical protein